MNLIMSRKLKFTGSFWWNLCSSAAYGSVFLAIVCVFYMFYKVFVLNEYEYNDIISLLITTGVLCVVALVIAIIGLFTTAVGTAVLQNGTNIAVRITSSVFPTHIGVRIGNGPFMDCHISNEVPFETKIGNEVIRIHHGFNLFTVKNYILEEYDASDGGAGCGNGGVFPPFPAQPPYYTGVR